MDPASRGRRDRDRLCRDGGCCEADASTRLEEFSKTIFRPERFPPQLDALAPLIRPALVEEKTDQLPRFDAAMAGRAYQRRNGTNVVPLKMFAGLRTAALIEQLARMLRVAPAPE